eukprot:c18720_g1_i2 orf=209-508(+)
MQRLQSMQWRVDVTFSTAHSHRLLRPSVLLRLELDDGSVRLVELDPESFGMLRCAVAELLAEVEAVKSVATRLQARSFVPAKSIDSQENPDHSLPESDQ